MLSVKFNAIFFNYPGDFFRQLFVEHSGWANSVRTSFLVLKNIVTFSLSCFHSICDSGIQINHYLLKARFYTADFCGDFSPFDACDWMDWLSNVFDHLCKAIYKSVLLWLNHSIACVRMRKIARKIAHVNGP